MTDRETMSGYRTKLVDKYSIRKFFLIATVVGSVGILFGVLLSSQAVAIILPILVMAFYIFVTQKLDTDLPNAIIGDSYYYLGFIFTLIALTASLWALTGDDISIGNIVGSFGAAMLTTVIGLIARLIITTFSVEAEERRERLEQEIELSLDRFLTQVNTMTEKVSVDMIKMTTDINTALNQSVDKYNDNTALLEKTANRVDETITNCVNSFSKRVAEIRVGPEVFESAIKEALSSFKQEMEKLSLSYDSLIEKISGSNQIFADSFDIAQADLQTTNEKFRTALISVISDQSKSYRETVREIGESIASSLDDVRKLKTEAEQAVVSSMNKIAQDSQASAKIVAELNESYKGLASASNEISNALDQQNKILEQRSVITERESDAIKSLEVMVASLTGKLLESSSALESVTLTIKEIDGQANIATNVLRESTATIKALSDSVHSDVIGVYKELNASIKKLDSSDL